MFHKCFSRVLPVFYMCFYQCFTSVSPVFHQCFISVSPVPHLCFTNVLTVCHQCPTSASPVFHQFLKSVLKVFQKCFKVVRLSLQLPEHNEGSFEPVNFLDPYFLQSKYFWGQNLFQIYNVNKFFEVRNKLKVNNFCGEIIFVVN